MSRLRRLLLRSGAASGTPRRRRSMPPPILLLPLLLLLLILLSPLPAARADRGRGRDDSGDDDDEDADDADDVVPDSFHVPRADALESRRVLQWRSDALRTGYVNVTLPPVDPLEGRPKVLWRTEGIHKGQHTAAKSSALILDDGTFLQPGDSGILYRMRLDGTVLWAAAQRRLSSFGYHGTPCVVYRRTEGVEGLPDLAIIGGYDGVLTAFDLDTGRAVWENTKDLGLSIGSSVACTPESVYVTVEFDVEVAGGACKIDVDTGSAIWCNYEMSDQSHSSPAVHVDRNLVVAGGNDGSLHVLRESDGRKLRTYDLEPNVEDGTAHVKGPVLLWEGVAIFGSWNRHVYALDLDSVDVYWDKGIHHDDDDEDWRVTSRLPHRWTSRQSTGGDIQGGPAIDPETQMIYVGSYDGYLYCMDYRTGKVLWKYEAGDRLLSSPVVTNNAVLVGCYDGRMLALAKDTGSLLWQYKDEGSGRITSSAAVTSDGRYVIFSTDAGRGTNDDGECVSEPGALIVLDLSPGGDGDGDGDGGGRDEL